MKKFLLVAFMAVAGITLAVAQPRAIGVNIGYGVGFSYQHNVGVGNMIDLAVEIPAFNAIGASCTYDWVDPFNTMIPWTEKGEWHWAMGVGAGAGMHFPSSEKYAVGDYVYRRSWSGGYVGAVGHIGVAYDFWFPLELSVDYRPNIGVSFSHYHDSQNSSADYTNTNFNTSGLYTGITLGVRYKF